MGLWSSSHLDIRSVWLYSCILAELYSCGVRKRYLRAGLQIRPKGMQVGGLVALLLHLFQAYGQTGSGKTFTMEGPAKAKAGSDVQGERCGMIPRAVCMCTAEECCVTKQQNDLEMR